MRQALELRGKQVQTFCFRPPDPVWSSTPHLADVRARLAQFDPRVTVWFAANRGRWRLMEWSNKQGFWRPVCFWEGPGGSYREADADAMIAHLGRMSVGLKDVLAKVEAHNERVDREKGRDFRQANNDYLLDVTKMHEGGRIVTSMDPKIGAPRKRDWLTGERGGSHRRMVRDHLIRQWEERNGRKWEGP